MKPRISTAKKVTMGAMAATLAMVFLYGGAMLPTLKIALYFLACVCVCIPAIERCQGTALLSYAAASLLGLLLLPGVAAAVPFIAAGHYGVFKLFIQRKALPPVTQMLLKLLYLDLFAAIGIAVALFLLGIPLEIPLGLPLWAALIIAQFVVLALDLVFSLVLSIYSALLRDVLFPRG